MTQSNLGKRNQNPFSENDRVGYAAHHAAAIASYTNKSFKELMDRKATVLRAFNDTLNAGLVELVWDDAISSKSMRAHFSNLRRLNEKS